MTYFHTSRADHSDRNPLATETTAARADSDDYAAPAITTDGRHILTPRDYRVRPKAHCDRSYAASLPDDLGTARRGRGLSVHFSRGYSGVLPLLPNRHSHGARA